MRRKSFTSEMMKSYIADSLLLLMAEKPFGNITVGEIVQKAGVNRSTYYRHFDKKEDIILYYLNRISEDILEWDKEQNTAFKEHIINVYQHYYDHKWQMVAIYKSGLLFLFLDVLKKNLYTYVTDNSTIDMQYNIAFYIGGVFNHLQLWLSRDMTDTPEEMANHALAVLPENLIEPIWKAVENKAILDNECKN